MEETTEYKAGVQPDIINSFASAAFRWELGFSKSKEIKIGFFQVRPLYDQLDVHACVTEEAEKSGGNIRKHGLRKK